MLIMGTLLGIATIMVSQFHALLYYWSPPFILGTHIPIEDFLYGFFGGGILSSIYDYFNKPKNHVRSKKRPLIFIALPVGLGILTFYITLQVLHINAIVPYIIAPLILGGIVTFVYPHLLKPMVVTGVISIVLTGVIFQILLILFPNMIENFWMLENLNGTLILNIPIEEYIFAFAFGFMVPFGYEVIRGCIPYWKTN